MKPELKKLLLLNLPYLLFVYLFAKCGQAYRLAAGADASAKLLHLTGGISAAFASPLPSLHPFDLCVGLAGAMAVQFQELRFDQFCRVIVPGYPDGLTGSADRFQQDVHDLVQLFPIYPGILGEGVILDVIQNQVPVDLIGRFLSASCPFRRRCRCLVLVQRQGVWGMDRNGIGI